MNSTKAGVLFITEKSLELESVKNYLEIDYNVFIAEDIASAFNILEAQEIDFAIIDISEDGDEKLDFITKLKYSTEYCSVFICVFSKVNDPELMKRAMRQGAGYIIEYPLNPAFISIAFRNLVLTYVDEKKKKIAREERWRIQMADVLDALNVGTISLFKRDKYYVESLSEKAVALLGYGEGDDLKELENLTFDDLIHLEDRQKFYKAVSSALNNNKTVRFNLRLKRKNGNYSGYGFKIKKVRYEQGCKVLTMAVSEEDVLNSGDQLDIRDKDRTRFDLLTSIYNKETFFEETARLLDRNPDKEYILSIWDIDRFKAINEMLGSKTGDKLIIEFAEFLRSHLNDGLCTYGRMESDHFVTCCSVRFHEKVSKTIKAILNAEYLWHSLDSTVFMHVGMYKMDTSDRDIAIACDRATMALHAIKDSYLYRINYFSNEMRDKLVLEQEIVKESESALINEEFYVMFQPIIDSHTREIVSAEALVRWKKKDGSFVSPGVFIPTFEKNGFVTKVDMYVLNRVCAFQADRVRKGKPIVPISVNLSRIDFYDSDLYEHLMAIVERYGLDHRAIKFEVTESAYMDQPQELMEIMNRLRKAEYQILMDDFGSGFSSLNMLKDFPVDVLKIDMKFMDSIDVSERASNILYSIIRMAKSIDMQIVAEGVETLNQYEMLKSMDCDCIQGYYFYRPLLVEDFTLELAKQEERGAVPTEVVLYKFFMISDDDEKMQALKRIFKNAIELEMVKSCKEAREKLNRSFAGINLVILDFDSLYEECTNYSQLLMTKPIFGEIPTLAFATISQLSYVEEYIRTDILSDIVLMPFSDDILKQRIKRTVEFFGVESERRALSLLRKSVLMRQQLDSFYENSNAGIARVVTDTSEELMIKEIPYVNNRFLDIHMITVDEALRQGKLKDFMAHIQNYDVDPIDKSILKAISDKSSRVIKRYDVMEKDGNIKSVISACAIKYLGNNVQLDFVLLEDDKVYVRKSEELVEALYEYYKNRSGAYICKYYIDRDLIENHERGLDGLYVKKVASYALDNLLGFLGALNKESLRNELKSLMDRLKEGERNLSRDVFVKRKSDYGVDLKYIRITFNRLEDDEVNGRCASCIIEDVTREHLYGVSSFREQQYLREMNMNAEIYIEADLTNNYIINKECLADLAPYGITLDSSYDQLMPAFKATVEREDYDRVLGTVNRKELIRQYRQGNQLICFDYMANVLANPTWLWYEIKILLGENRQSGDILAGIKLTRSLRGQNSGLTEKDSLTGLYNRVMFERMINRIITDTGKNEEYLFAVIDVDNFKRINDCFGHNVGDSILKTISRVLVADMDDNAVIGRLGGDEFAVFLPRVSSLSEVEELFGKINEETVLEFSLGTDEEDNKILITTSIGIIMSKDREMSFHRLYPKADIALTQAKKSGKNTYVFFENKIE
ncbi:MAG: EAL domain-containing protein [Lachnospiraceae bacterium]|nr:EAL domain-containing protein [Lachnospiraceae bacterium]